MEFVIITDDPAAPVLTEAKVIVAAAPAAPAGPAGPVGPVGPVAPVAPVSPFGIPKLKIALLLSPEFVTVAELPAGNVVVVPIVTDAVTGPRSCDDPSL